MAITVTATSASLTADGTANGYVTVANTNPFAVGAVCWLSGTGLTGKQVRITEKSGLTLGVRFISSEPYNQGRSDVSAFTTAASSKIDQYAQLVDVQSSIDLGSGTNDYLYSDGTKVLTPGAFGVGDLLYLGQIATASLPAASTSNKGSIIYDSTTNTVKFSDGSSWAAIAGTPYSNPLTTKGDLIVAATGGTQTRLAVGTNGQVLTADSTQTLGVKWVTGSGPTYTLRWRNESSLTPRTGTFTNFAQTGSGSITRSRDTTNGAHLYLLGGTDGDYSGIAGWYHDPQTADYAVRALIRPSAATATATSNIIGCRWSNPAGTNSGYAVTFYYDGAGLSHVLLIRMDTGTLTTIGSVAISEAVGAAGFNAQSPWAVELQCLGSWLTVKINGKAIMRINDTTYSTGKAILGVRNPSGTAVAPSVRADEWSVYPIIDSGEEF